MQIGPVSLKLSVETLHMISESCSLLLAQQIGTDRCTSADDIFLNQSKPDFCLSIVLDTTHSISAN